jgi:hypothetical protein
MIPSVSMGIALLPDGKGNIRRWDGGHKQSLPSQAPKKFLVLTSSLFLICCGRAFGEDFVASFVFSFAANVHLEPCPEEASMQFFRARTIDSDSYPTQAVACLGRMTTQKNADGCTNPLCGQLETTSPAVPASLTTALKRLPPVAKRGSRNGPTRSRFPVISSGTFMRALQLKPSLAVLPLVGSGRLRSLPALVLEASKPVWSLRLGRT